MIAGRGGTGEQGGNGEALGLGVKHWTREVVGGAPGGAMMPCLPDTTAEGERPGRGLAAGMGDGSTRTARAPHDAPVVEEATRLAYPAEVTAGARKILQDALALPNERLALAEELLDSVDVVHEELDEAWRAEILDRVRQVRSGEVELVSWEAAREQGREALAQRSR